MADCAYCNPKSEQVLWSDEFCRVILVQEPGFPGWCRVICNAHVRELSDLDDLNRNRLMRVVGVVERALIDLLTPAKMNLAALGTAAPHLHFHVIPRFVDDPTFPEPVWTTRRRESTRSLPLDFESGMRARLQATL
jgi:diadenosine tetraphosphate (Ap4A) HIT family hydrolase